MSINVKPVMHCYTSDRQWRHGVLGSKPLTNAERQQKYREKWDADPVKWMEYLTKKKAKYKADINLKKAQKCGRYERKVTSTSEKGMEAQTEIMQTQT